MKKYMTHLTPDGNVYIDGSIRMSFERNAVVCVEQTDDGIITIRSADLTDAEDAAEELYEEEDYIPPEEVLFIEQGSIPRRTLVDLDEDQFNLLTGGESTIYPLYYDDLVVICNIQAQKEQMSFCRSINGHVFYGPMLLMHMDRSGDTRYFTREEEKKYIKLFIDDEISLPIDPDYDESGETPYLMTADEDELPAQE